VARTLDDTDGVAGCIYDFAAFKARSSFEWLIIARVCDVHFPPSLLLFRQQRGRSPGRAAFLS